MTTTEPSEEALVAAELAADTLLAFERKFIGAISWTMPNGMGGMVTVDESSSRKEGAVIEMAKLAFQARLRHALSQRAHELFRREALEDEERREKHSDEWAKRSHEYMTEMTAKIPKVFEELARGKKTIHVTDPKTERRVEIDTKAMLERLGIPVPPTPGDPAQVGEDPSLDGGSAADSSEKPATDGDSTGA